MIDFFITNVQMDEIYGHWLSGIAVRINVDRFYFTHYTNVSDFTPFKCTHQFYLLLCVPLILYFQQFSPSATIQMFCH